MTSKILQLPSITTCLLVLTGCLVSPEMSNLQKILFTGKRSIDATISLRPITAKLNELSMVLGFILNWSRGNYNIFRCKCYVWSEVYRDKGIANKYLTLCAIGCIEYHVVPFRLLMINNCVFLAINRTNDLGDFLLKLYPYSSQQILFILPHTRILIVNEQTQTRLRIL